MIKLEIIIEIGNANNKPKEEPVLPIKNKDITKYIFWVIVWLIMSDRPFLESSDFAYQMS